MEKSVGLVLNGGLIDEGEARRRRKELSGEAEFYGAMDGASRFTQRYAIASIIITGVNIVAGFLIGVLQHHMDLRHALETYTVLTIGDGLVTVIPALMISISGGLISTTFTYDAKGNMTSGNGVTVSYTSYNAPASITRGTTTITFEHGPEHQRFSQATPSGLMLYLAGGGVFAERFASS